MEHIEWPKVSIIVTSYFESAKPYLDLCMESINNLSYPRYQLDVILVTKKGYTPFYKGVRNVFPHEQQFYNPKGINTGVASAAEDSKYYFILNDDVILTKSCLEPLVYAAGDLNCILMPLLSCHTDFRYNLIMGYEENGGFVHINKRFNRLNDWIPIKDKLMNTKSVYPPGLLRERSLCMVAPLIPRKTWAKIGEFDEQFTVGQDDIDYSLRATKVGAINGICLDSLVWHFGGASSEDNTSDEVRVDNLNRFKTKWGFYPT